MSALFFAVFSFAVNSVSIDLPPNNQAAPQVTQDAGVAEPKVDRREVFKSTLAKAQADIKRDCKDMSEMKIFWATQLQNDERDSAIVTFSCGKKEYAFVFFWQGDHWVTLPEEFVRR